MTRKIFVFLLAAMLMFSLLSCGNQISQKETIGEQNPPLVSAPPETQITQILSPENQSSETPPPNTTPSQPSEDKQKIPNTAFYTTEDPLAFQSRYFECKSISDYAGYGVAKVIRSVEEIEKLSNHEQFSMYDEAFFAQNNLVIYESGTPVGTERKEVVSAYCEMVDSKPVYVFNILTVEKGSTELNMRVSVFITIDKSIDIQDDNFAFRFYETWCDGVIALNSHRLRYPYAVIK